MNKTPKINALTAAILSALAALGGCVAIPDFPPPGPEQRGAYQVYNPNCVASCVANGAQAATDSNSAPVTTGAQSQTNQTNQTKSVTGGDGG